MGDHYTSSWPSLQHPSLLVANVLSLQALHHHCLQHYLPSRRSVFVSVSVRIGYTCHCCVKWAGFGICLGQFHSKGQGCCLRWQLCSHMPILTTSGRVSAMRPQHKQNQNPAAAKARPADGLPAAGNSILCSIALPILPCPQEPCN